MTMSDDDPRALAAGLAGRDDVTGLWEIAERHLHAGDAAFVADLGIAMWRRHGKDTSPPWQFRSAFDRMLRLLTLTPGTLDQALRLIAVSPDRRRARYAASLLASAHSAAELEIVLRGSAAQELRACLAHELVLRGAEAPDLGFHPLAWLPRTLTPLEGRPSLPHYHVNGGSGDVPGLSVEPFHGHGPVPPVRETTTAQEAAAIGAAVATWAEESNGRVEARIYALDADLHPDAVVDTLATLDAECLGGLKSGPGPCTATQAWEQLFLAASGGGAYPSGAFGAYGRLLAWQSVAALVGAPPDATAAEVEALAHAGSWWSFAATTSWFDNIAWDVGLAVVSPDRRRLALLAATDTD
jgi:hypothetical protein